MRKKVYVIAHTHWDREWYFTLEDSNILLVENLDLVIDTLEQNPAFVSYCFDAQASVIEEYLSLKPEAEVRLRKLITEKRLFAGPWYTQCDTLLINKESIIRNLYYGSSICNQLGHSMSVGYLPDAFGMHAYLPSMFQEFAIPFAVLKRGVYLKHLNSNDNFIWRAPDGAEVCAHYMSSGYSQGEYFAPTYDYLHQELLPMLHKVDRNNSDNQNLLYFAGGDQNLIKSDLPEWLDQINQQQNEYELNLSDLESFMQQAQTELTNPKTYLIGELRGTGNQRIHRTIGSMRYDLKQLNSQIENKLLHILEPLTVLAKYAGLPDRQIWLDKMWKLLFDCHAHDSIGGCNSDATNKNVLNRFGTVEKTCDGLLNLIKKQLTMGVVKKLGYSNLLLLFNLNLKAFSGTIKLVLFTRAPYFNIKDLQGKHLDFSLIQQKYISGGKKIILTDKGDVEEEQPGYYRSEILVQMTQESFGWKTFVVDEPNVKSQKLTANDQDLNTTIQSETHSSAIKSEAEITNQDLWCRVDSGKLTFGYNNTSLVNGFYFEDCADFGDSYDFSPYPENDKVIISDKCEILTITKQSLIERIVIQHRLSIPGDLQERKQFANSTSLTVITTITLVRDEKYIRINHKLDNVAKDHRLRVIYTTVLDKPGVSYADSGYSLIAHQVNEPEMNNWRENGYVEAPVPIYNMENLALIKDGNHAVGVIVEGLKEYEVLPDAKLALTLFRSVGLLGRDNLLWRPNRASGINNTVVATPEAQLQGELEFNYALLLANDTDDNFLFTQVESYLSHSTYYQLQSLNTLEQRLDRFAIPDLINELPEQLSMFELSNSKLMLSVIKLSHNSKNIIVRIFNPGKEVESTQIKGSVITSMAITNLAENLDETIELDTNLNIVPRGFVTVKISAYSPHLPFSAKVLHSLE